mmetsp:Transcript_3865/g.11010  ORF Transcript_3865/g.11010 Transcript_3865/m.11010 type:complete len:243 (-) Transcript_3865:549-1277(-)
MWSGPFPAMSSKPPSLPLPSTRSLHETQRLFGARSDARQDVPVQKGWKRSRSPLTVPRENGGLSKQRGPWKPEMSFDEMSHSTLNVQSGAEAGVLDNTAAPSSGAFAILRSPQGEPKQRVRFALNGRLAGGRASSLKSRRRCSTDLETAPMWAASVSTRSKRRFSRPVKSRDARSTTAASDFPSCSSASLFDASNLSSRRETRCSSSEASLYFFMTLLSSLHSKFLAAALTSRRKFSEIASI